MKLKILKIIQDNNIQKMSTLIANLVDEPDCLQEVLENPLYWTLILEKDRTKDHVLKAGEGKWLEQNIEDFDYKEKYEVTL